MQITSASATGLLSFKDFSLDLSPRVTFIVGPNGAGKSNLTRLLTLCLCALDRADGSATEDVNRLLSSFREARHVNFASPEIEARMSISLTTEHERQLVTELMRSIISSALGAGQHIQNRDELENWVEEQVTEDKLGPLMQGDVVASHPGTVDGQWECAYEFTSESHDAGERTYRWILLGDYTGEIHLKNTGLEDGQSSVYTRITGSANRPSRAKVDLPSSFSFLELLPWPDLRTTDCKFTLSGTPLKAQRKFIELTELPLNSPGGGRIVSLATVLRILLRDTLVQTSDSRLMLNSGVAYPSAGVAFKTGVEPDIPQLLLRLKNGGAAERLRYRQIQYLFREFTQGRNFEAGMLHHRDVREDGQLSEMYQTSLITVTVNPNENGIGPAHEIPIMFAGAGAWEALFLASTLKEDAGSVAILDEPAVALHPNLQRQFGAYVLDASAQFIVITHSAELLPLGKATDVQIVRFDRDEQSATRPASLTEECRAKIAKKLLAKGNERLPFARRAILCEGQTDAEAVLLLADRMGIDLRRSNIMIVDCGSRDNLSDYIQFCSQLRLRYLAIMDADASKPDAQTKAQAVRNSLKRYGGGELFEFPEDLETTLQIDKIKPSKVPHAIMTLPFIGTRPDAAQIPSKIEDLAEAIRSLAE